MKTLDIYYKDHFYNNDNPFNDSYQKWIHEISEKHNVKVTFNQDHMRLTGKTVGKLIGAAIFIGYAYGMLENGR